MFIPISNSVQKPSVTSEDDALRYLSKFGYLQQQPQQQQQQPRARARNGFSDGSAASATAYASESSSTRTFSNLKLAPDSSFGFAAPSGSSSPSSIGSFAGSSSVSSEVQASRRRENAVRDFQKMAGLPVTGIVDEATIAMMNMPRCGVKGVCVCACV